MKKKQPGVALVVGASTGIGRATAQILARAGYLVFGTSRKPTETPPLGTTMLVCDVTDGDSVRQMVNEIMLQAGEIDLVVNNVGQSLIAGAQESSPKQARDLFEVNFFGMVRVVNEVLPILRRQGRGRIVNISSVAGFLPGPFTALYNASKHAVEGHSESLDHELRAFGIRVALVAPAFTRTHLEERGMQPDQPLEAYEDGRAAMNTTWRNGIAAGDSVEEVAAAVVQAATDGAPKSRYMPGKTAGKLRLMRRFVPEKAFAASFRKQMGLPG